MINAIVRIFEVLALLFGVLWGGLILCVVILKWIPQSLASLVRAPGRIRRRRHKGLVKVTYWVHPRAVAAMNAVAEQANAHAGL